ncbi:hypothetical protein [Cohnella xylanilytica]|uniref:hypothetical protein n=1 Tax=Cohnella xylanilytica TaxID=557555 RepID=UPI001BB38DF1|nr:hypothetical protein [Cohnella xylanilytica]
MRTIPSAKKIKIRLGSRFTKISLFLSLIGAVLFTISLSKDARSLPAAVAIFLTGAVLTAVSQIKGESTNSPDRDRASRKRHFQGVEELTKAREEVTVIYDEENSVVLEYLPGKPERGDLTAWDRDAVERF